MFQTIYRILDEGYKQYPDNRIFPIVKNIVFAAKRVPTLMELYIAISEVQAGSAGMPATATPQAANADHRVMHIITSSFKTFSNSGIKYGVDFRDARQKTRPSSTVILGSNGIGKTSIYVAMEMVAMRHSFIGDIYGYGEPSRQHEYVRNTSTSNEPTSAAIVDISGSKTSYPEENIELCPRAFFCSQFDFQEYQAGGMDMHYVLSQMGRNALFDLMELMYDIEEITKKLNRANKMHDEQKRTSPQKRNLLKDQIKEIRTEIVNKLGLHKLSLVKYDWATDNITKEVSEVAQVMRDDIDRAFNEFRRISSSLIPAMLDYYLKEDDAKVVVTTSGQTIRPLIVINNSSDGIEPRQWMNTFRMKLFIIAIKMSLAFALKIIDKLNFPMIMDDVFDSSDFKNKFDIRCFLKSIVKGHNQNEALQQMPLQIICFTQDRIIGDNVYEGLLRASCDIPVKYCRMFHYKEATQDDKVQVSESDTYFNVTQLIVSSTC